MTVEEAVSAALENMEAARLTLQNYFGATEATIFSKQGRRASRNRQTVIRCRYRKRILIDCLRLRSGEYFLKARIAAQ
jgi:hypothetical protein